MVYCRYCSVVGIIFNRVVSLSMSSRGQGESRVVA